MQMPHAVDRPQPGAPGIASSAPGGASIRRGRLGAVAIGILMASLAGGGCRSGVRSMTAPKWPSFGASKPKGIDDTALTAAPKIDASTAKPSAAATPYPTTSTPAGYVVNEASPTAGAAAVGIQTAATDPATVTYGVAPPPQLAAAAVDQRPAPGIPESAPPQSISPQVGPYATLPTPPPPAETPTVPGLPPSGLPLEPVPAPPAQVAAKPPGGGYPLAPPATPSAFPSTAGYEPSRVADARSVAVEPAAPVDAAAGAAASSPPRQATPSPDGPAPKRRVRAYAEVGPRLRATTPPCRARTGSSRDRQGLAHPWV
jgi:hypothetical protein